MKKILIILTIISTSLVAQMNVSAMQSIANEELDKIRNELQNDLTKSNDSINNDPIAQEIVSLVPKEITHPVTIIKSTQDPEKDFNGVMHSITEGKAKHPFPRDR